MHLHEEKKEHVQRPRVKHWRQKKKNASESRAQNVQEKMMTEKVRGWEDRSELVIDTFVCHFLNSHLYTKTSAQLLKIFKETCDMITFVLQKQFKTKTARDLNLEVHHMETDLPLYLVPSSVCIGVKELQRIQHVRQSAGYLKTKRMNRKKRSQNDRIDSVHNFFPPT